MRKTTLIFIILLSLSVIGAPALGQDDSLPFPVQEIPLPNLPAYQIEVAPAGDIGAVYAGHMALILLNVPQVEYQVDPTLLPIRIIDLNTGEELLRLRGGSDYIIDVAFTSTGAVLASYHRNGDVNLWDVASGELIRKVDTLPLGSSGITFMPDDTTLLIPSNMGNPPAYFLMVDTVSGTISRIVRERLETFGEVGISDFAQRANDLFAAWTLSPNGTRLALATQNGEVKLWDMATLDQTVVLPLPEAFTPANFNVRALQFTADGSTLIYYNRADEQTHFWDVATERETTALPVGSQTFALSPDGNRLAWASRTDVWLADVDQPENARQILVFADQLLSISSLTFTPDGNRLIVGGFGTGDEINDVDNLLYVIELE